MYLSDIPDLTYFDKPKRITEVGNLTVFHFRLLAVMPFVTVAIHPADALACSIVQLHTASCCVSGVSCLLGRKRSGEANYTFPPCCSKTTPSHVTQGALCLWHLLVWRMPLFTGLFLSVSWVPILLWMFCGTLQLSVHSEQKVYLQREPGSTELNRSHLTSSNWIIDGWIPTQFITSLGSACRRIAPQKSDTVACSKIRRTAETMGTRAWWEKHLATDKACSSGEDG